MLLATRDLARLVASGGETTWVTRPDYEGNRPSATSVARDALLHHGYVTTGVRRLAAVLVAIVAALAIPLRRRRTRCWRSSSPAGRPPRHRTRRGRPRVQPDAQRSTVASRRSSIRPVTDGRVRSTAARRSGSRSRPTHGRLHGRLDDGEPGRRPLITGSFTFDVGVVGSGVVAGGGERGSGSGGRPTSPSARSSGSRRSHCCSWWGRCSSAGLRRRSPPLEWVQPRFRAASVALSAGLVVVWAEATVGSGGHSISGYLAYFDEVSRVPR